MFKHYRTKGVVLSNQESANQSTCWKSKTVDERIAAAMSLNSAAHNFEINQPPSLDRTVF